MNNDIAQFAYISDLDRAYLAGFFDADGAIMASMEKHSEKKFGFRVRLVIRIAQKNKIILEEIRNVLKWGHIRDNRGVYEYDIKNQQDVISFIELVYPFSRTKHRQLELARQIAHNLTNVTCREELLEIARLADSLATYNVRSQGRRKNYASLLAQINLKID